MKTHSSWSILFFGGCFFFFLTENSVATKPKIINHHGRRYISSYVNPILTKLNLRLYTWVGRGIDTLYLRPNEPMDIEVV
ncbi:hypothetical protein F4809DRAFT_597932 [Biscogniauxia mediterranea]|nr:hypothetical protein F4809DRAFT_597932 [Biscogniauxia mediterranea]